jgi:hypothetical protein
MSVLTHLSLLDSRVYLYNRATCFDLKLGHIQANLRSKPAGLLDPLSNGGSCVETDIEFYSFTGVIVFTHNT